MPRVPEYLSPSAIALYLQSPEEYYSHYIADEPTPRPPQTQAMAAGSAFDAYVKSYLHNSLFGGNDPRFDLRTIFESQVEPHQRDWAWPNGKYIFSQYQQSGCLADLMLMLESSTSHRFEFELRGSVNGFREGVEGVFGDVVLLGKPDVDFVTAQGVHVILDWKVNGYCSNHPRSPAPNYLRLRAAGRTDYGSHAKCHLHNFKDVEVDTAVALEDINEGWARQLSVYAWLCGNPIGSQFVTAIHQVVCSPNPGSLPKIRIAELHHFIRKGFQQSVFDQACTLWDIVNSDHFFRDVSKEESQRLCEQIGSTDIYAPVDIMAKLRAR